MKNAFLKQSLTVFLLASFFLSGFPGPFWDFISLPSGRIVDISYMPHAPFGVPAAEAAAKTKTVVFFIGSIASTTAVASAATTTFTFTIAIPDMVPSAQPIRSAYIAYSAWQNNTSGLTASVFTLNKQGGSVQALTGPKLTALQTEQQLSIRLDATAAMRALLANVATTTAMTFTAKLTGPTRMSEAAELYVTYDYDPLAPIQVNTAYQYVFASAAQIGTTNVSSTPFNFNLPENTPTTTFTAGASSTNHFWIEYRGFVATGTGNPTVTVGWAGESTSSVTFTQVTQQFSFLILAPPKTAGTSPNVANTFRMIASVANGISAPTAIAIATYTFNFSASTKLRKTIQIPLIQSTSTNSATTVNGTTTVNIPEASPSSTNVFLFGRLAFSTSSNPGVNAFMTTSACTAPAAPTAITISSAATKNSGYPTIAWNVTASSTVNAAGNWNVCSTFTRSAVANIPGLVMFLSYDYANNMAAGSRFNTAVSFLGASHLSATGTNTGIFAASGINASLANASATATYAWLDAEFDNNAAGTTAQTLTLGIGAATNAYTFIVRGTTARRQGATFSATSSVGFSPNATMTVQCSLSCINDAAYNILGQTDMIAANLSQVHYHWRNNDGGEATSTAQANEDAATSTVQQSIDRLRIEIANLGDATGSAAFRLEYQKNATSSGGWIQLATSTAGSAEWQMATSSFVVDGIPTTNIATSTGGTTNATTTPSFFAGEMIATTSRNQTASYTLTGTQFTESEFTIQATANASTGVPYYFRVSNAGTAFATTSYLVYPSMTVTSNNSPPVVSNVVLASSTNIVLIPNATTSVNVSATVSDANGCADITNGTTTILLYRSGITSSTCIGAANNANCYIANAFTASSTCSANAVNATTTFGVYYFAQATDASSSFPSQNWLATVIFKDPSNATGSADSTGQELLTLNAINVTTSSINYGALNASSTTGGVNQTTTVQNVGNSSTTLQISGAALVNGALSIATSSQHYATSSFIFGGLEQQLNGAPTTVPGFSLAAPISTGTVQGNILWGIQVPAGSATGTYTATTTFTAVFSP